MKPMHAAAAIAVSAAIAAAALTGGGGGAATCHLRAGGQLPDRSCSPGARNPALTTKVICDPAFRTGPYRHVTSAQRDHIYDEYGLGGQYHPFPEWEVDHIISLELGGSNSNKNLFPQHFPRRKDAMENAAHDAVCAGDMTLAHVQHLISNDWRKLARELGT